MADKLAGRPAPYGAGRPEPWIETRQGGWFFVNALLVAPELVVLFPAFLGGIRELPGPGRELSPFLDTIPFLAESLPFLGWILVIPIWTTRRTYGWRGFVPQECFWWDFFSCHLPSWATP